MKTRHSPFGNRLLSGAADGMATAEGAATLDMGKLLTPPRSLLGQPAPTRPQLKIIILGPPLTASVGDCAVSTYRGLVRELTIRGHEVLFLERRDGEKPGQKSRKIESGRLEEYSSLKELKDRHTAEVREADFVLVASQITDATDVGEWINRHAHGVTAFYDLGTPSLPASRSESVASAAMDLVSRYDLYLSFSGGPFLDCLEDKLRSTMARPLYPAVEARQFFPEYSKQLWDLGYIGNCEEDRLPVLERLLIEPARRWSSGRFIVSGSGYPRSLRWPANVVRTPQIVSQKRRTFYNSQRFTLAVEPPEVVATGYAPSARLFESAACGTPVITEFWPGLEAFFTPDEEILVSHSADETLIYLQEISELDRRRLGYRARERVLARHTTRHRAAELEGYVLELLRRPAGD